jgi:glycerol-3-phosphate dehydrogenase (NAD(P)+)
MAMTDGRSMRVAVIGAGSWGTTVASVVAPNASTVLWARNAELVAAMSSTRRNDRYLPDAPLPDNLEFTASLKEAVSSADVVVMGVPSHGFRDVVSEAAQFVRPWVPVVSLSKGLERSSLKRMSEVVADEMPGHPVAVLTGPNLAKEIMAGQPAAAVVAIDDTTIAQELQKVFSRPALRVYTNPDVVGSEIAGVAKNVIAIASGMAAGMGFGDNTRASIITRGLAEMTRLGMAMGGEGLTFAGLAGMGDLIATCSSTQSRNNQVGLRLGRGETIDAIMESMTMVAEGVKSSPSVLDLARRHDVEMPITEQVVAVCHQGRSAVDAMSLLMKRRRRSELG